MPDDRIIRSRILDLLESLDSGHPPSGDTPPTLLAATSVASSYPAVAGAFFACNPVEVDGDPVEGGTVTFAADTSSVVFAYNAGSGIPPVGTRVHLNRIAGRWVFSFNE